MIMRARTTHSNPGRIKRIIAALDDGDGYECAVGFPKSVADDDEVNKAIWNNYGTSRIPARPFMDLAFHAIEVGWKLMQENLLRPLNSGERTAIKDSLEEAGQFAQGEIVFAIDATVTPTNAPSTIKRKKSSHPLIDQGSMKQSATYDVRRTV